MAQRPVFIPSFGKQTLVEIRSIDFDWHAGIAPSRKRLNVQSLHSATHKLCSNLKILEVSRFSESKLGIALSAFNLLYDHPSLPSKVPIECVFQSSKVFENGGPFRDLLHLSPNEAKRDPRIHESGRLKKFVFSDEEWELSPETAFYDYMYISALVQNKGLVQEITQYDAFTDIAFNPKKSINCQAGAVALFVALTRRGEIEKSLQSKKNFISIISGNKSVRSSNGFQGELF